jgi:DNA ligase-1
MFKPMLASPVDFAKLRFPCIGSPKLDGIRGLVVDGTLRSRSLKPIRNIFVNSILQRPAYDGLDGELIVGPPTAKDVYLRSNSGVMSRAGDPDFTFWVFDRHNTGLPFASRYASLQNDRFGPRVRLLPHRTLGSLPELLAYEEEQLDLGFEGLIIRDPAGLYKFGRSTPDEGILLKLKRFEDSEARILGVEEEMFNGNEAQTNELGRTKRSTAKAGLVGKGTMGALRVRDIHYGWEFSIGTGFTAAQRAEPWVVGSLIKYKYFPVGMKDVPRHPVYLGPRDRDDLS